MPQKTAPQLDMHTLHTVHISNHKLTTTQFSTSNPRHVFYIQLGESITTINIQYSYTNPNMMESCRQTKPANSRSTPMCMAE